MRWLIALALALGAAAQSNPFADNLRRLDEASGVPPDTPEPDDEGPDGPDSDGACSAAVETGLSGDFDEITLFISTSATAICASDEEGSGDECHEWLESFVSGNIDRVEAIISLGQEADMDGLQAQKVQLQAMLVQVQTLCVSPPPPPPSIPTITDEDIAAAGAIVGGVLIAVIAAPIAGILLLIVLIIVCVCCCCKKKATSPA